jgi:TRAP-type uncharacterized transport system substrate-binding protein
MRRPSVLPVLAVILALIGVSFGVYFISRLPRTLTMAVGPAGLETHRYAEALAQAGIEARDRIRLRIITTEGAEASARLMESGKVDLAIIRSDYDLPTNGQSILVNTKRAVVVMAPQRARGGIRKFDDLKGKRIAVVKVTDPNLPLVRRMLTVADIGENAGPAGTAGHRQGGCSHRHRRAFRPQFHGTGAGDSQAPARRPAHCAAG